MKALPLWQPWASLVAVGAKRVETRHWPAPTYILGQRIAIHATKTDRHLGYATVEPFRNYLPVQAALPLGAIIATVVVDRCVQITRELALQLHLAKPHEFAFGDYTPGRYAWVLRDVETFPPVPWKGSQGIFEVPDDRLPGRDVPQGSLL